ncbi:hypothetical protein DXG01_004951 [Tephrocybe rancida]|nr:hypothetical protein DXG01_004951 [Tephrocybe rancida]
MDIRIQTSSIPNSPVKLSLLGKIAINGVTHITNPVSSFSVCQRIRLTQMQPIRMMLFLAPLTHLSNAEAIRACLPIKVPTATFEGNTGYLNTEGGWADAEQGVAIMIAMVVSLGCKVLPGKPVKRISKNKDGKTNGVECEDGTFYAAATVVIATGSWTSSAFPDISPSHTTGLSTGRQCVAMIQLNEEEAALYGGVPVIANFGTGFYIFPPTSKGIIKMGMHLPGYTHTKGGVSTPRTITDSHSGGLLIPKHNVREIRTNLRNVYPKLAEKPFFATRLCWYMIVTSSAAIDSPFCCDRYNDSPDGNWIIGQVPGDSSLILATAGSGHAYKVTLKLKLSTISLTPFIHKFLPVIGRLVADAVDGTIQPDVAAKFSIERSYIGTDESRSGAPVVELDLDQLCTPEDLQANTLSRL